MHYFIKMQLHNPNQLVSQHFDFLALHKFCKKVFSANPCCALNKTCI